MRSRRSRTLNAFHLLAPADIRFGRLPDIPASIAMNVMALLHADAYFRPK
jgi:hypothetical protein